MKHMIIIFLLAGTCVAVADPERPFVLPGEMPAEDILDGKYWWPDSPAVDTSPVDNPHFVPDAFGTVPDAGVHPRILISPEGLPALRDRINNTISGRFFYHQITFNQEQSIRREGTFCHAWFKALAAGDEQRALDIVRGTVKIPMGQRYSHRYGPAYVLMTEAFDALVREDEEMGREVAAAVTTLSEIYMKRLEAMDHGAETGELDTGMDSPDRFHGFRMTEAKTQFNSDVWRSGRRSAIDGEPWLAFMYDYAYTFMTAEQRAAVRATLNKYHYGKTTMGSHMPHHFRNWNWVAIGSGGLLLTALATEGEEGNDPRVIDHAAEVLTDFVKYGWSDMGSSNEAIGYTQFGLRWGVPGLVALARREVNVWNWKCWRGQVDWYAHASQPDALNQPRDKGLRFLSHGDGGQGGPAQMTMQAFKCFYPTDPQVDFVAQMSGVPFKEIADENGKYKIPGRGFYNAYPVEDLLMHRLDAGDTDYREGEKLGYPNTFFDPERNSLITRSQWGTDQLQLQMEARNDSTSPNHQHADSGAFTLSGAGRVWADERFRAIESRHHSMVTVDGKGQGYFTPPADWLGLVDNEDVTIGAVDTAYSYAWAWPGHLCGFTDPDDPRRPFPRWQSYREKADKFMAENPDYNGQDHIDRHPTVEKFYKGFEQGDPRIWDEYGRPRRMEHNPVEKAFRTAMLVRGKFPYVVITDDIRKDDQVRLYEWLMMLPKDVELFSLSSHRVVLYDAGFEGNSHPPGEEWPTVGQGSPMCLVQVLERTLSEDKYTLPDIRFEKILLKEARRWPDDIADFKEDQLGANWQKRLVVPSRAVEPNFKMLLYPHRKGDPLPEVSWNEDRTEVSIAFPGQVDTIAFTPDDSGRTPVRITRAVNVLGEL
ncbi:hypothetical protein PDESU_04832 [Pontiella desulfatans]|uniref:Heparinase II N-terminal domain-containing protein n=1 Tax=Pontiella desulfatans TaxID=2750659 RepID=A0A6C2U9P4_PONDE|nr:hypothetical protein [Pontiella desulfatans]VGO16241.1 hypothetical protein PDESU_04832 [Pontiella desulfatans]